MRLRMILIAIGFLAVASSVYGRTWRVERDGSGDFVVIQDAVDAAAAGDVIQIGRGRFDEWEAFPGYPDAPVHVLVEKDLRFIGAGTGETLIGPEDVNVHPPSEYFTMGFRIWGNGVNCTISGLTIENMRWRGIDVNSGRLEMDQCEIRGCLASGVFGTFAYGGWIRDCSFHDIGTLQEQGIGLGFYSPSVGIDVVRCSFNNVTGVNAGAWWSGCRDISYRECEFENGNVAVGFFDQASGSVCHCAISHYENYGIALNRCGSIAIEDNEITQLGTTAGAGIGIGNTAQNVIMEGNVVVSDSWVLMIDAAIASSEIRDNHFLREGDQAWWVWTADYYPLSEPRVINLENNYWGTTDTALLDQWIYDGNDDNDVDIYVDYQPMLEGPVQIESTTWGAVKALFR